MIQYILYINSISERNITISESQELDGFGGCNWKNEEVRRQEEMSQSGGDKHSDIIQLKSKHVQLESKCRWQPFQFVKSK